MLKIGVTGGIGSGKSTVCKIFETLGIPVFYADEEAREVMIKDQILIDGIKKAFGNDSYTGTGALDNKYIADIVFNDKVKLEKLNSLVHPAVFRAFDQWLEKIPNNDVPYVLKEAALLFESGSYKMCDNNLLVISPAGMKINRVIKRDGVTEEQVEARMNKQFADEQKEKMSDFIIINDESSSLILQVINLHNQFLQINH